MALILRTPDKKLKLTKEEIQYLVAYLDKSKSSGFAGVNFYKHHPDREEFYKYFLLTLCEKLFTKLFNLSHEVLTKKVTITINYAEEKTLLTIFKRVDCSSYLLALQAKILLTLKPHNTLAEI